MQNVDVSMYESTSVNIIYSLVMKVVYATSIYLFKVSIVSFGQISHTLFWCFHY